MFKLIKGLFQLLTISQRKRFYTLQILVIVMSLMEVVGITLIAPFMALASDISILERNHLLATLYIQSGLQDPYKFIFLAGIIVLISLTFSTLFSMLTTWKLAMFAAQVGTENADRLYTYYLNQTWLFHSKGSSSQLVKKIANESVRVTDLVILPLIMMNAKLVLIAFLLLTVFLYDPIIATSAFLVFGSVYISIYWLVKTRLAKNGKTLSDVAATRFRLMHEGFGGIKDVLLLNRSHYFTKQFEKSGKEFAFARGNNHILWQIPRYFMELLAFGLMISLVLYFISLNQEKLDTILPLLAVYALAGVKFLPAFQQIYASIGQIKGNIAAFEEMREDLLSLQQQDKARNQVQINARLAQRIELKRNIMLKNISFTYPDKTRPALHNINMIIPKNSLIGIVGPSGSGKSSTIDILLALIPPQQGELWIDDTLITEQNRSAWQNTIGFVPQSIFLSEGSIAENIAFGIPEKEIDFEQITKAIALAHLDELVQSLDQGIHTRVGERGVKLSGGQRQRIGIARALYHEASVLVFDEATSALDGITEKIIMEAIHNLSSQKTIIMIAHRLKTVQECDQIFFIDQGQVVDQGTYQELIQKNDYFRRMASHS